MGAFFWRTPPDAGMGSEAVVKDLSIGKNSISGLNAGVEACEMHQLTLEAAGEVFSDSVVIGVPLQDMLCSM